MEEKLEEKCGWKVSCEADGSQDGFFAHCSKECDGYNTNCEYYVSVTQLNNENERH